MKIYALRSLLVALVLSLSLAAPAFAGSSTGEGYREVSGNVQQEVVDPPADAAATRSVDEDTLPFTGMEIAFIGIAGLGLVGVGFGLRALTRRQSTAS